MENEQRAGTGRLDAEDVFGCVGVVIVLIDVVAVDGDVVDVDGVVGVGAGG